MGRPCDTMPRRQGTLPKNKKDHFGPSPGLIRHKSGEKVIYRYVLILAFFMSESMTNAQHEVPHRRQGDLHRVK